MWHLLRKCGHETESIFGSSEHLGRRPSAQCFTNNVDFTGRSCVSDPVPSSVEMINSLKPSWKSVIACLGVLHVTTNFLNKNTES